MQRRHRTPRPIAMVGAWLREAPKQLAMLGGRKRESAHVPGAGLQLV
jgi:hypothetical protein